ncbi:ral guanine nucleotide dissociation stimulator-like [Rattus norvegicus]|uniref:ral guanine nucleotide dissociation stimulator-like n=1 Tax=Rattus norvegicus TaxID=10116 RepID=UPI00005076D8|nr:ral guanine nucleotide dissociation stimulator-like [Rattus norvegicus]
MFSCCCWTTRGSGPKKDNRKGHDSVWRHRVLSCLQCMWPFSQKEKKLSKASPGHTDQVENASAQQDQMEAQRGSSIRAQTVVEQMNTLMPSLSAYRHFASPLQILDLLFVRDSYLSPYSKEDEQVKNILWSFLETWMDKNPEDFCDPSDLLPLQYLEAYLSVYIPNSDLIVRVKNLLIQLQEEHAKDSQAKDEEDSDLERHTSSDPQIECV